MIRIGVVGAGANTRLRHIPGFQSIDGVSVTAVVNRSRASSERVASEFGIENVYDDWRELVHANDVDAVCVGTWPYLHAPVSLECLRAGKHVLTEARMAMDASEARSMLDAADAGSAVAMVVPAPFFLDVEPTILDLLEANAFGEILEIHVRGLGGGFDPSLPIHWRQRRDLSGNNVLTLGILNETVRRYAGDEKSVLAHGRIFTESRTDPDTGSARRVDVPDSLAVIAEMRSGATAVYHLSGVARDGGPIRIEMHGTAGSFVLEEGRSRVRCRGEDAPRPLDISPERRGGWQVEADFIAAVRGERPVSRTSFADGLKYMLFTDAVQESLRTGRRVEVAI